MPTIVDLNSKIVGPAQQIWIVHTGRNRSYIDIFRDQGIILLEYPGLVLTDAVLANRAALRQGIRFSRAVRSARGYVRADGTQIRLADFSGDPATDVHVPLRTVEHLACTIKDGDLVVVPGRGAAGRVLFGEVAGSFRADDARRVPGIDYADTPVRRVRWLKERSKRELPGNLVSYFEKPPAIAHVNRGPITDQFFDYAYDAYSTETNSWLSIDAPKYDGRDLLSAVAPAQLIAFAVALYKATEENADFSGLSFEQIIEKYYDEGALREARLSFNSPGVYGLRDADHRLAKYINVIVALALAGMLTACGNASVENSKAANDPSIAELTKMVNQAGSADQAALQKAQDQAAQARQKVALKTPAVVR